MGANNMARPTNAELAARKAAAEAVAEVVEAVAPEAPAEIVTPVAETPVSIDLRAIAASVNATFTPHEHGGVFEKGTRKVSLNMANYKSERQARKILSAHGF